MRGKSRSCDASSDTLSVPSAVIRISSGEECHADISPRRPAPDVDLQAQGRAHVGSRRLERFPIGYGRHPRTQPLTRTMAGAPGSSASSRCAISAAGDATATSISSVDRRRASNPATSGCSPIGNRSASPATTCYRSDRAAAIHGRGGSRGAAHRSHGVRRDPGVVRRRARPADAGDACDHYASSSAE
jgi:hypothetical protein